MFFWGIVVFADPDTLEGLIHFDMDTLRQHKTYRGVEKTEIC